MLNLPAPVMSLVDLSSRDIHRDPNVQCIVEVMFNLRTFSQVLATVFKIFVILYFAFRNVYTFSKKIINTLFYILFIQTNKYEQTKQNCCYNSLKVFNLPVGK